METEECTSGNNILTIEATEEEQNVNGCEPKTCCGCGDVIDCNQETFETDGCMHRVCVRCRFKDIVTCRAGHLEHENPNEKNLLQTNLYELEKFQFSTKKKINKDHIIPVDCSPEDGTSGVLKQFCTVCQRTFKKTNASYHYGCMSGEKPYSCVECGRRFAKKAHMESHLNRHYGIKPFKCNFPKCNSSFTLKDKLIRHMKTHEKIAKHPCPVCKKPYTTTASLNIHLENVHSSVKAFQCDLCPRSYKYQKSLKIHQIMKHQGIREHMCEVCGKKYALYAQLKLHTRSHVMYHRRPHKCRHLNNCNKRFMTRRDRARHELIHITSHDFECSLCNTTFGRKDNLERHMKNFHQEVPQILSRNSKPVVTVISHNVNSNNTNSKSVQKDNCKIGFVKSSKKLKITPKYNTKKNKTDNKLKDIKNPIKSNNTVNEQYIAPSHEESSKYNITLENQSIKNQSKSVIVSSNPGEIQNRPSVIKTIQKLLPYRILPPDERFLNLTEENLKKNNVSDLTPPPVVLKDTALNIKQHRTSVELENVESNGCFQNSISNITPVKSSVEKSSYERTQMMPQAQKVKILSNEALNRSYRIIHHTDAIINHRLPTENPLEEVEKLVEKNIEFVINLSNNCGENSIATRAGTNAFALSNYALMPLNQRLTQEVEEYGLEEGINRIRTSDTPQVPKFLGVNYNSGSSMAVTLTDNNNHVGNFTDSIKPIGESYYSSHALHFDSVRECESGTNEEILLPNDFDMGFQYISEQLSQNEILYESRVVKIASKETRLKESFG